LSGWWQRVIGDPAPLPSLAAAVYTAPAPAEALDDHPPAVPAPVRRGGRERHRLRDADARRRGFLEPGRELPDRVGIDVPLEQAGHQTRLSCRYVSSVETPTPTRRSAPGRSARARSRSLHASAPISPPSSV